MKISTPEVAKAVAEQLANGDDREQAAFFNTFFRELDLLCRSNKGASDPGLQLYMIVKSLDGNGRSGLAEMAQNLERRIESEKTALDKS